MFGYGHGRADDPREHVGKSHVGMLIRK
jgi:hypothetical protein